MNQKFKFKKKYGQNFIKNERIINDMVEEAKIEGKSLIIEVGPGSGVLTKKLADVGTHILCYEIDDSLEDILAINLNKYNNIKVLFQDFLDSDLVSDTREYNYDSLYFVSNVPYYITTPIVLKLANSHLNFKNVLMMVQKEVGDRFCARPGKRDYSSITVFLNYYYNCDIIMNVNRKEFHPVPNVDSVVIKLTPKKEKLMLLNEQLFFKIVRDSFQYKRKNIRNNLKNYDLSKIEYVLNRYGYDLTTRAENIPVEVFVEISNTLV